MFRITSWTFLKELAMSISIKQGGYICLEGICMLGNQVKHNTASN